MGIWKLIKTLFIAIPFVVPFAVLLEETGKPGEEKRREVVNLLKREIANLGFTFPSWFERFVDPLLGLIVDVVVEVMNKTGFFVHGEGHSTI
ncbi:MAG: hypothetical protein GX020_08960 [Firmicutes bacterium]|nr:hypothetical protein [Bacillota bacterium]